MVDKICIACGKTYRVKPFRAPQSKYCCRFCKDTSAENKAKISQGQLRSWTTERKKKFAREVSERWKDPIMRESTSKKLSIAMKKKWADSESKFHSKEYRDSLKSRKINVGENNGMWKGDQVSSEPIHRWVQRRKPKPLLCEDCKKSPPYDLANISQEYHRDINDFEWLCRRCHMIKDGRIKNLTSWRE